MWLELWGGGEFQVAAGYLLSVNGTAIKSGETSSQLAVGQPGETSTVLIDLASNGYQPSTYTLSFSRGNPRTHALFFSFLYPSPNSPHFTLLMMFPCLTGTSGANGGLIALIIILALLVVGAIVIILYKKGWIPWFAPRSTSDYRPLSQA